MGVTLTIVSGDQGMDAGMIERALAGPAEPQRVVLADYEPLLWTDVAAERTDEICHALLEFLARIGRKRELPPLAPTQVAGAVAGRPLARLRLRRVGGGPGLGEALRVPGAR